MNNFFNEETLKKNESLGETLKIRPHTQKAAKRSLNTRLGHSEVTNLLQVFNQHLKRKSHMVETYQRSA